MSLNQDNATSIQIQSLRIKALSLQNDIAFAAQKQEVERDFLRQQIAKTDKELEALKAEVSDSEDDNEDSAPSTPTQVQQDTTLPTASDGGFATPPPRKRGRRMSAGKVSSSNASPTISLFRTPRRSSSRESIRRASRAAFLQEKRRQLEDAAAVSGARPNVVILSEDDFPMPAYDRRRSSLTLSSTETSIDSAQSETASDKLPTNVYSDLEEGTKLQMAARKLKKKLNLNPWEPTSLAKYDDEDTRDLIKDYPQVCRVKLDGLESFPSAPIFPLNVACAMGASLKTIMNMYRAYPAALENDFAAKYSPVGNVIHFCVSYGAPLEVVEFLVDASSTNLLSRTNNFGRTPLHLACVFKANYKVIDYLLNECPFAAEMYDKNGNTPLALAKEFDAGRNAIELLSQATSNRPAPKLTMSSPAPRTPRAGKRRSTTGGRRRSTLVRRSSSLNLEDDEDDEEGGSSEFMSPSKTPKTPRASRASGSNPVDEMFTASSRKQQQRARTMFLATPVAHEKEDLEASRAILVEPLASPPLAELEQNDAAPSMMIQAESNSPSTVIQNQPSENADHDLPASEPAVEFSTTTATSHEELSQLRKDYLANKIANAKRRSKLNAESAAVENDESRTPAAASESVDDLSKKPAVSSPPTSPEPEKPISMFERRKQLIDKARAKAREQNGTSMSIVDSSNDTASSNGTTAASKGTTTSTSTAFEKKSSTKPVSSNSTTASRSVSSSTAHRNKNIRKKSGTSLAPKKQKKSALSRVFGRFIHKKNKSTRSTF